MYIRYQSDYLEVFWWQIRKRNCLAFYASLDRLIIMRHGLANDYFCRIYECMYIEALMQHPKSSDVLCVSHLSKLLYWLYSSLSQKL